MTQTSEKQLLLIIISLILPPLAAYLKVGVSGAFIVNIILTLLGWLPGVVHAIWLVLKR